MDTLPVSTAQACNQYTFDDLASWAQVLLEEDPKYQYTLQFLRRVYEHEKGKVEVDGE